MKRFLFILTVLLFSFVFVYSTIGTNGTPTIGSSMKSFDDFLSSSDKVYRYESASKSFVEGDTGGDFYYHAISPIDGMYYKSKIRSPINIVRKDTEINIRLDRGEYVFVLNDIFTKYNLIFKEMRITQIGKGVFYVSNLDRNQKIYSLNSVINVSLFSGEKSVTDFLLFPLMLFNYNPANNNDLYKADILRIADRDPILFRDMNDTASQKTFFPKNGEMNILSVALLDMEARKVKYKSIYSSIIDYDIDELMNSDIIDQYPFLFQNSSKKGIYLKAKLAKSFLEILKTSNATNFRQLSNPEIQNMNAILSEMQGISPELYRQGVQIIRNYYYIAYYGNSSDGSDQDLNLAKNNVDSALSRVLQNLALGDAYFTELSDIFQFYDFGGLSPEGLDRFVNKYIAEMKDNNFIKSKDVLSFYFFLMQYAVNNKRISKDSISIVGHCSEIFNRYLKLLESQQEKESSEGDIVGSAMSLEFFYMSQILTSINLNLENTFFERKGKDLLLKEKYIMKVGSSSKPNIGDDILQALEMLHTNGTKDLETKKARFLKYIGGNRIAGGLRSNYHVLLGKKYDSIKNKIQILKDYDKYLLEILVGSGIEVAQTGTAQPELSLSDLKEYLSTFKGVETESIRILNADTLQEDRYYDVSVMISGQQFEFRLAPNSKHLLSNLTIRVGRNVNEEFAGVSVSMDEKKDQFSRYKDSGDPRKKVYYDFESYFINIFIKKLEIPQDTTSTGSQVSPGDPRPGGEEDIWLSKLKQDILIDQHFRNLEGFMPITFDKISASKKPNGDVDIRINGSRIDYAAKSKTYIAAFFARYDLKSRRFEDITLKSLDPTSKKENPTFNFDSLPITIVPGSIGKDALEKRLADLGPYFELLSRKYVFGTTEIKFDLNSRQVYINSQPYQIITE